MQLEFIPRRPISAACMLVSPGDDRRFYRLSNRTQHIWFDHERQADAFFRALLDGRLDSYHRRLPIYIPDEELIGGLWFYTNVNSISSNPGISQNYTFDPTWTTTNLVETIAGGGGGGGSQTNVYFGGGAGGGAYAAFLNLTGYAANTTTNAHVGAGGTGGVGGSSGGGAGNNGGRTWFGAAAYTSAPVWSLGGFGSVADNLAGGGNSGAGTTINNGGSGSGGTSAAGAGAGAGGGGAGASAKGGNASGTTAGAGGSGALQDGSTAGAGGTGGAPSTNGHDYGGGGAGASAGGGTGRTGAQGIITVAWTPAAGAAALSALIICG